MFLLFKIIVWYYLKGRDIDKTRPRHERILRATFFFLKRILYPVKDPFLHISNCNTKLKQQIKESLARISGQEGLIKNIFTCSGKG